jgi:hypothetical protein
MLLTGLVLWSRMMVGFPGCLDVICLEFVSTSLLLSISRFGLNSNQQPSGEQNGASSLLVDSSCL